MARPVRALLMTSNGVGMGHLSRMLAVALAGGDSLDVTVLSLSGAYPLVARHGLVGEYCPSPERGLMPLPAWQVYLRRRLVALAREVDAEVIAFDGVTPYPGLVAAGADLNDVGMVWVRRGMWRPGGYRSRLARSAVFDLVVEPGDLAAAGDRGPTAARSDAVRVPPVTLLDVVDRLDRADAAAELGIDADRPTALVTLGGGGGDAAAPGGVAVRALLEAGGWQVCVTRPPATETLVPLIDSSRVTELRGVYPLCRYLAAFDVAVSSAGYNAVHELVPAGVPTLLVPNEATGTDDQVARAEWLAGTGLALCGRAGDPPGVAAGVGRLVTDPVRADLAAATAALPPEVRGGGAAAAARLVRELPASDSQRSDGAAARAQRIAVGTREGAKRAVGHRAGEGLRRLLRRRPAGGPARRLEVTVVGDPAVTATDRPLPLVLAEEVTREQTTSDGIVVEHLLPGSSAHYRAERLAIAGDAYRVVPG